MNKLQQKLQRISDSTQSRIQKLLEGKMPAEVADARWNICLSCDKLYRPTSTCKVCGCFMQVKTRLPEQSCPLKKWNKYTTDQEL